MMKAVKMMSKKVDQIAKIFLSFISINIFANKLPPFFEKVQTKIQDPMNLRDPFKSNLTAIKSEEEAEEEKETSQQETLLTNVSTETLEDVPINRLIIVGTLLGPTRLATAKVAPALGVMPNADAPSHIIKEGMILGENKAEVRAIVHGGIVLVEKIRNVYEQDEYIETIIPLTQQKLSQSRPVPNAPTTAPTTPPPPPPPSPEEELPEE